MPARDSHGEDRMAARQGEPDFDLRQPGSASPSGASRHHKQAAPVQAETDSLAAAPEAPRRAETYGADIFPVLEDSGTAAQDSPSQVFSGQEPAGPVPYVPETGWRDFRQGSQRQGSAAYRDSRQEGPRQKDSSQGNRNAVYQNFGQEISGHEDTEREDSGQDSPWRRNAAYQNFRQEGSVNIKKQSFVPITHHL